MLSRTDPFELLADALSGGDLDVTFSPEQIACYGLHVVGVERDPRPASFVVGETDDFLVPDAGSSPTTYSPVWCKNDRCRFVVRVETAYFPFHPGTEDGSLFHSCPADPNNAVLEAQAATQFGFSIKPHRCHRWTGGLAVGTVENPTAVSCELLCSETGPANVRLDEVVATLVKDVFPRTTQLLQMRVQSIPHVNPSMYTSLSQALTGPMPAGVVAPPLSTRVADEAERVVAMAHVRGGACAALTADMEAAFLLPDGVLGDTVPDPVPCAGNSYGAPDAVADVTSGDVSNMCLTYYSQFYANWPDPTTTDGEQRTRVYVLPDSLEIEPVGWTSTSVVTPNAIKKSTTVTNGIENQFAGSTTTWNDFIGLMTRVSRIVKRGLYPDGQQTYSPSFPTKPTLPYVFSGPSEADQDLDLRVTDGFCFNAGAMVDFYTNSFVASGSSNGGTFTGFRVKAKVRTMINDPTAGRRLLSVDDDNVLDETEVETIVMIPDGDSLQTCRNCVTLEANEVVVPLNMIRTTTTNQTSYTSSDDDDNMFMEVYLPIIIGSSVLFCVLIVLGVVYYKRRKTYSKLPSAGRTASRRSKRKGKK